MKQHVRQLHKKVSAYHERRGDAELFGYWLIPALNGIFDASGSGSGALMSKSGAKRVLNILLRFHYLEQARATLRPLVEQGSVLRLPSKEAAADTSRELIGWDWLYRYRIFDDAEKHTLNKNAGMVLWQTNELLQRYKWSPVLELGEDERFHDFRWTEENSKSEAEYHEKLAVSIVVRHFEHADIRRFRRCDDCSQWFYSITDHQRFCRDSCRKHYASGSDEYHLKRKLYMRKHRRQQKEMNAAAFAAARRERKQITSNVSTIR